MTRTATDHINEAIARRDRIVAGQNNEPLIQAWAGVCRQCAIANDKFRSEVAEVEASNFTRRELNWLNRLDSVWMVAKAQVETLRQAA